MVRLEVSIDDTLWPNLRLVVNRTNYDGSKQALTRNVQYDQAYSQFENDLHNHLRPMVDQLIKRRNARYVPYTSTSTSKGV
jgi:hypothetical protein